MSEWQSKYTVKEIEAHSDGYQHCINGGTGPNPHVEESGEWLSWEYGWGAAKSMMEKDEDKTGKIQDDLVQMMNTGVSSAAIANACNHISLLQSRLDAVAVALELEMEKAKVETF